jgi:DNA-binding MarR family transcriptional regulator
MHALMTHDTTITGANKVQTSQYPCLCALIRKAGRILTKHYDQYLKPSGLKTTQYSMLANIAGNQGITVTELANLLLMDQSTITRNLRVLRKLDYILHAV